MAILNKNLKVYGNEDYTRLMKVPRREALGNSAINAEPAAPQSPSSSLLGKRDQKKAIQQIDVESSSSTSSKQKNTK